MGEIVSRDQVLDAPTEYQRARLAIAAGHLELVLSKLSGQILQGLQHGNIDDVATEAPVFAAWVKDLVFGELARRSCTDAMSPVQPLFPLAREIPKHEIPATLNFLVDRYRTFLMFAIHGVDEAAEGAVFFALLFASLASQIEFDEA